MFAKSKILVAALVAGTALATAAGPTLAQGWGGGPGMGQGRGMNNPNAPWRARFAEIDRNHDGAIDRDEVKAYAADVFAVMDANGDGKLTREEYMAVRLGPQNGLNPERVKAMQDRKAARFAPMDTDGDGFVSKAEFLAGHGGRMFALMDRNRDGKVTPAEFRGHGW